MTVRLYKSTDASAPVLTGQVGKLVALLDAVLVNGYGSQTAAGWTKAFSGTNAASYRQGAGSNSFYLDVNDNAPSTAQEARMRGYQAMTALATGTSPFPSVAQSSFGLIARKSQSADATARNWLIVADSTCFYLFVDTGDYINPTFAQGFAFGDNFSYKAGDTYNTLIIGRTLENTGNYGYEAIARTVGVNYPTDANGAAVAAGNINEGHFMAASWTGIGTAIQITKFTSLIGNSISNYSATIGSSGASIIPLPYPHGPDGGLVLTPLWNGHNQAVRGYMKGFWAPNHYRPLNHWDTFTGTGNMAGKSFIAVNVYSNINWPSSNGCNDGQIILEYSDTWS